MRFPKLALCTAIALICSGCTDKTGSTSGTITSPPPQAIHTVKSGEFLVAIANKYQNVGWEEILLANESFLKTKYDEVCGKKSQSYRSRPSRRGLFCNDRYRRPYGNTLMPGWQLIIPAGTAPPEIEDVVSQSTGHQIAIVIDDTGSMGNDIQTVSQFYAAAVRKHGKEIIGIWLYADGQVRRYEANGTVSFQRAGGHENTYGALKAAAQAQPDTIILVTDEPGDDWRWPVGVGTMGLPPVVATCLPENGTYECAGNLQRLVKEVGGKYVPYKE